MKIIALIASIITAIQVIYGVIYGTAICPNEGCRVVEKLSLISPLSLNLLGLVFFQCLFWGLRFKSNFQKMLVDPLFVILMTGLVFDSVLVAYQFFVAQTLCAYCLLIFGLVATLAVLYSKRLIFGGIAVVGATFFSFAILVFTPTDLFSGNEPLKSAAYGLKSCSEPSKEIHLIFSSNCPYCENVLQTLSNCNSCDLYLNPIDHIDSIRNLAIDLNPNFSPEISRLVLGALGIKTVPVLVVKNPEGYRFIKGESRILNYVKHACFTGADVLYYDSTSQSIDDGLTLLSDEEGECSIEIDCAPK